MQGEDSGVDTFAAAPTRMVEVAVSPGRGIDRSPRVLEALLGVPLA